MAVYRTQRTYSKKKNMSLFEEEGANDIMKDYKEAGRDGHIGGVIGGATIGAGLGGTIGHLASKGNPKYALAGGVAGLVGGGYAGHRWGKNYKKKQIAEGQRKVNIYKNSSPSERAEMRRQRLEEARIRQMQAQAYAQQQMAWNSWR